MVIVNNFIGINDSERIQNAINGRDKDGIVIIPPRESDDGRSYWLLDSAILIPEDTTIIIRNCKIKLSDKCRDNFFRSANCGLGIEYPDRISNIHLKGEGLAILEGADNPRSTGDSEKILHAPCPHLRADICKVSYWVPEERRISGNLEFGDIHNYSYGTDANNPEESQNGDWRNIGVLFANAERFSITDIKIVKPHCWGISLEECSYGRVERIEFDACMSKEIDGMLMNVENEDGVDIRNGCHHITVSNICGSTGDDVVALTAVKVTEARVGGSLHSTHVMHTDWSKRDCNIHDIVIRNITAHSYLCYPIRLLPAGTHIYNVLIDGVIDYIPNRHTIITGTSGTYGENFTDGLKNIIINNIISTSLATICVSGYMKDSVISNIVNANTEGETILVKRENGLDNVIINGSTTKSKTESV